MVLGTVGHRAAAETVALLKTGETATDRVTADIHLLASFEIADRDGSTQLQAVNGIHAVFAQMTKQVVAGFC